MTTPDNTKQCSKCKREKPVSEFHNTKRSKDGKASWCKVCMAIRYLENKDKVAQKNKENSTSISVRMKAWRAANRLKIKENKKRWDQENKNWINTQQRERRATDINFRIAESLRKRVWKSVRKGKRAGSAIRDCGCSVGFLRSYLESKFLPGMTWDNWGPKGWHIDHITPLVAFDLTEKDQFLAACHYTNLQPLWWKDNLSKSAKF
jgi:hypothetical protein